ncbi:MAG: NAD-dependent glycerol-3-phosphate dehydrogenase domain [Gallionellaceae bacterium]|nr:MAG: NAD-dependent glycerol-3-phosphate dehydrogenase domain [Gallionellaceae bacterium]
MKLRVLILGYGEMGHAMEYLLAARHDVHIWNMGVVIKGMHATLEDEVASAQVILFCLPVNPHHEIASRIAPYLAADSVCLTIAKGLDETGRTAAQVFERVFAGRHHYGVVYGPMISEEIRMGRHAFADAVLSDAADFEVMHSLFRGSTLVCQQASDMHGRSWSVILKNVYAILFGVSDELKLGDNMRGHLMVAAIAELSGIVQSFGGKAHTPYSYAGLGDLLTTATSEDSHHHALGRKLVRGEWSAISGEGVHTLQMVEKFHVFDWRSYPLFSLAHDVVTAPEALHERMAEYLKLLRETQSCAI